MISSIPQRETNNLTLHPALVRAVAWRGAYRHCPGGPSHVVVVKAAVVGGSVVGSVVVVVGSVVVVVGSVVVVVGWVVVS